MLRLSERMVGTALFRVPQVECCDKAVRMDEGQGQKRNTGLLCLQLWSLLLLQAQCPHRRGMGHHLREPEKTGEGSEKEEESEAGERRSLILNPFGYNKGKKPEGEKEGFS